MRTYDEFEEPQARKSKRDRLPRRAPGDPDSEWSDKLRPTPSKIDHAALPMRKALATELQRLFRPDGDLKLTEVLAFFESKRHLMNHVTLTDLLNRLSAASLNRCDDLRAGLVSLGTLVLGELLSDRVQPAPGPREITTAWRAVSSIGIKEADVLEDLARRTKRILHAFDTRDFAFAVTGLVSVATPSPAIKALLSSACAMFQGQIPGACPDSLVSVLLALRRSVCIEPTLVRKINASFLEQGDGGCLRLDSLSLNSMGALVRCNAELRHDDPKIFSSVTERFYQAFFGESLGGRILPGAAGAGEYVWASVAAGYQVPRELLNALEGHIHEEISRLPYPNLRLICSIVALPALLVSCEKPSDISLKRFHELEFMERLKPADSAFERSVAAVLSDGLGLSFEREFAIGPYSLDFLVRLPGGRTIDIETDGDMHHLVWNVATGTFEPSYRGRDIVRDKVMEYFGVETVRVLGSEWEAADDKTEHLRQRLFGG